MIRHISREKGKKLMLLREREVEEKLEKKTKLKKKKSIKFLIVAINPFLNASTVLLLLFWLNVK